MLDVLNDSWHGHHAMHDFGRVLSNAGREERLRTTEVTSSMRTGDGI